jgi:hypothetical protein
MNSYFLGATNKETKAATSESKYWKDLTGMKKAQFLHAVKKEKDDFFMFGMFDLKSVNLNHQSSNQLSTLSFWDKIRDHRIAMESKILQKLYEIYMSEKPRDFLRLLKDKFSINKHQLEEGIVVWHERYVSG